MPADITPAEMAAWVADYEAHERSSWVVEVDPDEALRIAQERHDSEEYKGRMLIKDSLKINQIGAMGELAGHKRLGFPYPVSVPGGDGGVDVRIKFRQREKEVTIDIKTRSKASHDLLLITQDKFAHASDWLIMARLLDARYVELVGWECKSILALHTPQDFGYGRPSYARPAYQLRPMYQLEYLLQMRQAA
ncbi:MAG TPA: hypothetical protein VK955_06435 [Xanthobacteraceae bacterium]|nr:hypothetical protein [Xanthobacteraceae bacterium]